MSNSFNEWRRRAMKKPVDYKSRILDAKPHMLKHNINMNGEDLLEAQKRKYQIQNRKKSSIINEKSNQYHKKDEREAEDILKKLNKDNY